ncbi:MAG TPA: hypothetical protein VJJ23_00325 [Candidatus Nanoarchaeia archaeon]|nr:hypothetical protein [Candidatus Nanoarchaeia archaeon]
MVIVGSLENNVLEKSLECFIEAEVEREELNKPGILLIHSAIDLGILRIFLREHNPQDRSAVYYQKTDDYNNPLPWGYIIYKKQDIEPIEKILTVRNKKSFVGYIGHKDDDYAVVKVRDRIKR